MLKCMKRISAVGKEKEAPEKWTNLEAKEWRAAAAVAMMGCGLGCSGLWRIVFVFVGLGTKHLNHFSDLFTVFSDVYLSLGAERTIRFMCVKCQSFPNDPLKGWRLGTIDVLPGKGYKFCRTKKDRMRMGGEMDSNCTKKDNKLFKDF